MGGGRDARLEIGKFCSIAEGVKIFLGGNHRVDWITTYPFPALLHYWPEASGITGHPSTRGDVIIGNDVWIGTDAIILSGVKIGDGAVIGAGAVVTQDVNPYSIVIGNPAREIRRRFSDAMVDKLLEIRWWDWPPAKIRENLDFLCSTRASSTDTLNPGARLRQGTGTTPAAVGAAAERVLSLNRNNRNKR